MDDRADESEIHSEIGRCLIGATQEHWTYARLIFVASQEAGIESCSHTIENPAHPSDVVMPTDELFLATRRLELLYRKRGHPWKTVQFEIHQNTDGRWAFKAKFGY